MRSTVKRNKERQEVSAAGNAWRKEKPNQRKITNVAGNAWRDKTKHAAERNRTNLLRQERHGRQTQKIAEQTQKGQGTTNLYPANTKEVGPRSRGLRGRGLVVRGKGGLYLVFCRNFFWERYLAGMVFYLKEVINGWDHLMHAIELGSEVEVYSRNKQKGILSWNE